MSRAKEVRRSRQPTSSSFVGFLKTRMRESPASKKGARTRERLKLATASGLQSRGYHAMRVTDITEAAGLADGSFYIYFRDKKDASLSVLSEFLNEFVDLCAPPEAVDASFRSIHDANLRWFALCRENAGLMRCVFQLGDEDPDFASLVQRKTQEWYVRTSRNLQSASGNAESDTSLLAVYMMGSMMDELVRKLIIFPDHAFQELLRSWGADEHAIAEAASLVWIRMFNPAADRPEGLTPAADHLARMMWLKASVPDNVEWVRR